MIDYEKLKKAHKLADKYTEMNFPRIVNISTIHGKEILSWRLFCLEITDDSKLVFDWKFTTEDDLLDKLKELTQPEPKYKVGDEVWIVEDDECQSYVVDGISGSRYYLSHPYNRGLIYESKLYPTKQALIEAQIAYWLSLKIDEDAKELGMQKIGECQHESDSTQFGPPWRCKKCGEFYK
jgi:hypothetical protein